MANLKELRNRIGSVKSTEKISSAMKMISASRLRKAQVLISKSSLYHSSIVRMTYDILNYLKRKAEENNKEFKLPKIMTGTGKTDNYLLIVIASDRGLCGSYNSNIIKEATKRIEGLKGKTVKIICFGRRAKDALKRNYSDLIVDTIEGVASNGIDYGEGCELFDKVKKAILENEIDICEVIYSKFHSALNRENICQQLYPMTLPEVTEEANDNISVDYFDYEPNKEETLNYLIGVIGRSGLYQILINSQASEHGARMASMDNATRNAKDMISKLTLKYNRLRQSAITTELTEIISGAEAI